MSLTRHFLPVLNQVNNLPTCLVAGGAGFIGSNLCEKLLALKTRVICIDSLETNKKDNIDKLLSNRNCSFIKKDITQPIKEITEKIDYIFHLAGLEENLENRPLGINDLLINSLGTKNLLDLAIANKAKFLLGSTRNVNLAFLSSREPEENFSSFYSPTEAKRYSEALTTGYHQKYHLDSRIIRVADVFGPLMDLSAKSRLAEIFSSAIFNKEMKITGEGLEIIYPTNITDLIEGMVKTIFKNATNGKVFNLIGEKISLINFAYLLQKAEPEIKIIQTKAKEELFLPANQVDLNKTAREIGFKNRPLVQTVSETLRFYHFQKQNKETINRLENKITVAPLVNNINKNENQLSQVEKKPIKAEPVKKTGRKRWFNFKSILIFTLLTALLIGLYPVISLFWYSYAGLSKLKEIEKKKVINNLDQTMNVLEAAASDFDLSRQKLDSLGWFFTLIHKKSTQEKYLKILTLAQNLSQGGKHAYLAGKNLNVLFKAISGEKSEDLSAKVNEAKLEISQSKESLALGLAELKNLKAKQMSRFSLFNQLINLEDYEKRLVKIKDGLDQIDNLLTGLPAILGEVERKTYLILLQNNTELRATGGFIGSYALATLEDGKLIDFKVEDIYTADGQLKGKVNPPDEILHYLGQPNWYLRDSNFSPDFLVSAQRARWFLEKELGVLVDGVIGVDLSLAEKLVKTVGPLDLPDYQEKITDKNLFEKTEYQSEINFFPGSKQKKNFLTSLGKTLFNKILHASEKDYLSIAGAISEGLKEKHLAFYFSDAQLQSLFSKEKLTGEISQTETGENNDYLMVVDSNFGANKANYFVKRTIKQEINIGKLNEVSEKVTIYYKNNSPTDSWPGGNYKNYLRVLVPTGAIFEFMDINENKKPKVIKALTEEDLKKLKPDEFLVIETTESGRKSWGVFIEVPVGKSKSVTFSYRLKEPMKFTDDGFGLYFLDVQKQLGTVKDQYELYFGYPAYMKVVEKGETGLEKPQVVYYNTDLLIDRDFQIKLRR